MGFTPKYQDINGLVSPGAFASPLKKGELVRETIDLVVNNATVSHGADTHTLNLDFMAFAMRDSVRRSGRSQQVGVELARLKKLYQYLGSNEHAFNNLWVPLFDQGPLLLQLTSPGQFNAFVSKAIPITD